MSLNNRISFREASCAPGREVAVADLRAVTIPINGDSSEATMETTIIESEKSQKDSIGQSAEVDESKSHDRHVMVPIFS